MVISFHTKKETNLTRCWYSIDDSLSMYTDGRQRSYDGFKAGYNHDVILTNLQTDTLYNYQCGDDNVRSSVEQFRTRRPNIDSFTFGVYGDLGVVHSNDTMESLNRVYATNNWELVWHLGDISYANDHLNFEGVWNSWFERMRPILSNVPYMVSPGNHEKWSRDPFLHQGSRNFTAYEQKFRMPGLESVGVDTNLFYSFDYGPMHLISINTEYGFTGYPVDPEPLYEGTLNPMGYNFPHPVDAEQQEYYLQMNWLEEDLKAAVANRDKVPWIFVGGHRPIYEVNDQKNGKPQKTCIDLQNWLEPLFQEYEVDVYFAGHVHHYSRNWPIYNSVVSQKSYYMPKDTTYLIHGAGGNIEGHEAFPTTDIPDWYAFGDGAYGYGEVTIFNSTTLQFRAFAAGTDALIDEITLTRSR
jgi:predicted phosphodiesterase